MPLLTSMALIALLVAMGSSRVVVVAVGLERSLGLNASTAEIATIRPARPHALVPVQEG